MVNFTQPSGTAGNNVFTAILTGSVSSLQNGGVFLNFDNTAHLFSSAAGPFTLTINDVSINPGQTIGISGQIQAVPEPATWGMMLLGFAGIGFVMRRKRQPALAQLA